MRYVLCSLIVALSGNWTFAEEDYVPLAVGNHWTMAVTKVSPKSPVMTGTYHEETTGTVKKNGHEYFKMQQWVDWKFPNPRTKLKIVKHTTLVRKTAKAYYSTEQTKAGLVEGVIYRLPLKAGASWPVNWATKHRKITVLGQETVKVAGRTYRNCYHLRVVYPSGLTKNLWLAPGVGKVELKGVYPGGQKATFTLTGFQAGK